MNKDTLGGRIRTRRQEAGISQLQLADRADISQPYVSELEKGKFDPTVTVLLRIAKALKVPVGELLGEEGGAEK